MELTRDQAEAAKRRRLKEPLEITGYDIVENKIRAPGSSKTKQEFTVRRIETIGDLARVDAHCRLGKFVPVPDLSLQALMIVIDRLGLLEDEVVGPTRVVEP